MLGDVDTLAVEDVEDTSRIVDCRMTLGKLLGEKVMDETDLC